MRKLSIASRIVPALPPLALLAACLLAFGISIPWLGLYADDWPFAYVHHVAGLRGVVDFISWVRPVAAWVFAAASALVGTHFWLAHALLLVLRWLASLLFWRMLLRAFPAQPRLALWAALLFAVYPGFKQSPLAVEYVPHFVALILLFGSLWASLRLAAERPARAWPLVGLAWLGAGQVFILEYFVGLELLRPALLWIVHARREPARPARPALLRALRGWLPFTPVLVAFVLWRVFVVGFPSYQPELVGGLGAAPLAALLDLARTILHDVWTGGLLAWAQPFTRIPEGGRTLLAWGGVIGVGLAGLMPGLVLAGRRTAADLARPDRADAASLAAPLGYAALGLLAMLAAGWPFWITRIPLSLDFPWDRTTLAFMPGACLLAAGLLGLAQNAAQRARIAWLRQLPALALAVLLAFSIGLHFQNANAFRKESALLTNFYWQLTWRAPGLEPGTAIVLDQPPFNYHVDKFLSPQLNWIYAPDSVAPNAQGELVTPYAVLDFHKLWGNQLPPKVSYAPLSTQYGTLRFHSGTEKMLFVVYAPPGCLRVLTGDERTHLLMSPELKKMLDWSNLDLIQPNPPVPAQPPGFLGPEPAHDWCYSFAKAELALQQGDYASAAQIADEAFAAGQAPRQPSEYLPIVYAYTHTGRWEDALRLSQSAATTDFYRRATCATWERIGEELDAGKAREAGTVLGCK